MVGPTSHITDHHVGDGHDLTILGLLNEDGDTASDELTIKLDALCTSYELAIAVVTCRDER